MKSAKVLLSILSIATLALTVSSCSDSAADGNTTANNANKNTAVVVNTNQTTKNNSPHASNTKTADTKPATKIAETSATATPESDSESEQISGELQVGKTESVILYVGEETGDYAAYCFTNDSDAGRAILARCKNKEQCEVLATLGEGSCTVPGLEAPLSAAFRLSKVNSVKSLNRRK